jgi:hypothetical protein
MATRMQQRRGTASQWTEADPILAAGEIGFETDTNKFKVGDGTNNWSDLTYFLSEDVLDGTLDEYVLSSTKGQADGVATLDGTGNIPLSQLGNITGDAPEWLNSLEEIADSINNDPEIFTTISADLTTLFNSATTTSNSLQTLSESVETFEQTITAEVEALNDDVTTLNTDIATKLGPTDLSDLNAAIAAKVDSTDLATQMALKADLESPTFTGSVSLPSTTTIGTVGQAELSYLDGVTSAIQTQIDAKLDSSTASTTYATIAAPTFTGTVALPSTTSIGNVDATEIAYVNGVTSNIQDQLNAKAPTADPTFTGTVSGITSAMVGLGNVDNTSDADKPVSTATQTALDAKASLSGAVFTGDVTIEGNINIAGTTTTVNAAELVVADPLIYMSSTQYATDSIDIGFLGAYGTVGGDESNHLHSGLFRDVSDNKKWKLISNVPHPVGNIVNVTNAARDTLVVGNLEATGVVFSDGTQTKQGVPSITTIAAKTDSYTLSNLNERDTIVEISKGSATTLTIPTNSSVAYPVGTTIDIIQTGSGQVTIAGAGGVTVNGTPGLKLRTQWSSATLLKRAENTWLVYGDLTA